MDLMDLMDPMDLMDKDERRWTLGAILECHENMLLHDFHAFI